MSGVFIGVHRHRIALTHRHGDQRDFFRHATGRNGARSLLLTGKGERVLVRPRDPEFRGNILGGLGHAFDAISFGDHLVDETPADRRVVDLGPPGKGRTSLGHDEGRAAHALGPARDHQITLTALDLPRPGDHRIHAGGAKPVDRVRRYGSRQPGQEHDHPRQVAVVLARLVRRAQNDLIEPRPVHRRVARQKRIDRNGREVVSPDSRQHPAITPDRRALVVADEDPPGHARCAVASISTNASSSTSPATTTIDIAGKCFPKTSR